MQTQSDLSLINHCAANTLLTFYTGTVMVYKEKSEHKAQPGSFSIFWSADFNPAAVVRTWTKLFAPLTGKGL
jgi:hypothetical protein